MDRLNCGVDPGPAWSWFTKPTVVWVAAAAIGLLGATAAFSQGVRCVDRNLLIMRLAEGFGESQVAVGTGTNGVVVEVFASLETGTWTFLVTHPNGMSCMAASGENFEFSDAPVDVPPSL